MIRIAIDLLWLKHNNIGGVESYIRNLLNGMLTLKDEFHVYLLATQDNYKSFEAYCSDARFEIIVCNTKASNSAKSIIWMNLHLDRLVSQLDVNLCFVPNSRMPFFTSRKNRYVCTIHDLQALHFPQYFSKLRYLWLKYSIACLVGNSYRVVAISNFVADDIVNKYHCDRTKIKKIYNPIAPVGQLCDFSQIEEKYGITKGHYYYTISSLLKHKNTITLLKMMDYLVNTCGRKDEKLLISGIKGDDYNSLNKFISERHLENNCIYTGFVSDMERDTLIKYTSFFLFPSIFEGFGMPVVEALRLGTKVITTKCASLREVSQGCAIYVDRPYDEIEWVDAINKHKNENGVVFPFTDYYPETIARQYLEFFNTIV